LDLGKIFLGAGKAQEAKEHALLILRSNPKNLDAQILLSGSDSALGNQKDALAEAHDAVTLEPNSASAYVNLALLQQKWGVRDEAEANFKKAQSLDPNSSIPRMYLGAFYENHKRARRRPQDSKRPFNSNQKNPAPRTVSLPFTSRRATSIRPKKFSQTPKLKCPTFPLAIACLVTSTSLAANRPKR
jgi:tetratricopeptide (TPR) repeat protein